MALGSTVGSFDVAVVGGGPAGATAAFEVAKAGGTVCVLEKETYPRFKVCGGGLVKRATDNLPPGYAGSVCKYREVLLENKGGVRRLFSSSSPVITMTTREELDEFLIRTAEAQGAVILEGAEFSGFESNSSTFRLNSSIGTIVADHLIAADGANSTVGRFLGIRPSYRIPAVEYEVDAPNGSSLKARFDFGGSLEGGYGWVFPKRDRLSIGVLRMSRSARSLRATAEAYLEDVMSTECASVRRYGYVIPIRPRKLVAENVLFVGDAAGLADPVTAEGISNALLSGKAAAAALEHSGRRAVERAYVGSISTKILRNHRVGRLFGTLFYRFNLVRDQAIGSDRVIGSLASVFGGTSTYGQAVRSTFYG